MGAVGALGLSGWPGVWGGRVWDWGWRLSPLLGGVARMIGVEDERSRRALMRGPVGMREIAAGVGILTRRKPAGWLWARVASDVFDLAMLGAAFVANARNADRRRRVVRATAAIAGITATDVIAGVWLSRTPDSSVVSSKEDSAMHGRSAITIRRPIEEVYSYWHDFENLPRFMAHLHSVNVLGSGRSRWKAKAPGGVVEWEAEIIGDTVNESIAWRSLDTADVQNSGSVRFVPAAGGQGTEVIVELEYAAPGGKLGATVAKLLGEEPVQQMRDDLRRFKQVMETGEVVRSEGSPDGTTARGQLKQRPAQPLGV